MAEKETRGTSVLAIKVMDPTLGGLTVSSPTENRGITYSKGELHFKHMQISDLAYPFEHQIEIPVVDETGLTNYYDFSVPWDSQTQTRFMFEASSRVALDKMLNKIGLSLETANAPVELLVVRHL